MSSFVQVAEVRVNSGEFGRRTNRNGEVRAITIHYLKRAHLMCRVHAIIENKFCCW